VYYKTKLFGVGVDRPWGEIVPLGTALDLMASKRLVFIGETVADRNVAEF
jgi:hypothetical protein